MTRCAHFQSINLCAKKPHPTGSLVRPIAGTSNRWYVPSNRRNGRSRNPFALDVRIGLSESMHPEWTPPVCQHFKLSHPLPPPFQFLMPGSIKNVAVMGSTGSIGRSTLDVVAMGKESFRLIGLTAFHQLDRLVKQCQRFEPRWAVAVDAAQAQAFDWSGLPSCTELLVGPAGLDQVARAEETDIVVAAIVGAAGLSSTWAALQSGKRVALANKETLVAAGPLVQSVLQESGGEILPVDSEHSAIFQSMAAGQRQDVQRVILTASGGPFRAMARDELNHVTVEQALAHPTWNMGAKISIDSATMMNKALEMIEARWLFDLHPDQIQVVIHPQSIVHSMVEFRDGSVIAQMSPPDMRLPIQYALTYPDRLPSPARKNDFSEPIHFDFFPPDPERFPAIPLGYDVARAGGTAGVVVNAANEAAVAAFIQGQLKFTEIVPACRTILDHHDFEPQPSMADLLRLDTWARQEVSRWICN